jgi:hypothetical protein
MPALDFPASPTNGQAYGNWIWNSSKGAWQAKPLVSAKTVTSDVPPSSPANGDQWFNTVDSTLYIYYTDVDGSQWVESRAPIISDGYYSPNYIINGGFDIWQRGTSSTGVGYGSADRFIHAFSAGSATISRSTDVPSNQGFTYSLSFASTSGTNPFICQRIESANSASIAGKTVTLSVWAKSTVGTGPLIWDAAYPTATDNWTSETYDLGGTFAATMTVGTWTRYSATFTANALATRGYRINMYRNVTTTSTTTLYTGVQLEEGSVATPFRRNANSIQGELAACQRYFQALGAGAIGRALSNTLGQVFLNFPVKMRTTPILTFGGNFNVVEINVAGRLVTSINSFSATDSGASVTLTTTGLTVPNMVGIDGSNNLLFSAEL